MKNFFSLKTLRFENGKLYVIDQRLLPKKLVYVKLSTYNDVAEAIKKMVVRGAPAIGVAAAMGLALTAYKNRKKKREEILKELYKAKKKIESARPTAINLFWALNRVIRKAEESGEEIVEAVINEANRIAQEDFEVNRKLGEVGASLINTNDSILTHCKQLLWKSWQNAGALATVGYGTALGVVRAAIEKGKNVKIYATETRPKLQGARLTVFELMKDKIPVTLITDNMVGYVFQKKLVNKVIVGADRILVDGHVINKIGTLTIAVLAKHFNIPFYVAAPLSTFDLKSKLEEVKIEERSPEEVKKINNFYITVPKVKVLNPAFDVTPPELVTGIITEKAILKPPYHEAIPKLFKV